MADITNLIFDNIPLGILSFNSKNQCYHANKYMYDLFGLNILNNKNKNFYQLFIESIHQDDLNKELNICDNFFYNLQPIESISKLYNKEKSEYRYILIKRVFLKHIKKKLHYIYIFQDIHEKKQLELQLQKKQKDKIEPTDKIKQTNEIHDEIHDEIQEIISSKNNLSILLNISHQIRTQLNGIIGMLTLLEDTNLSTNQIDYISMVKECSFNLITIINDILDFSKLQNNDITLNHKSVNIKECINNVNDIILPKIYEKGLKYYFKINDNIPQYIMIDSFRLNQIILNILTNSVKFTDQGKISLNIYPISIDTFIFLKNKYNIINNNTNYNKLFIRFDIIDTGQGINKSDYNKLFKYFNNLNKTSGSSNGTGLGLTICKKLVELMNGIIWLEDSNLNKGSTFSFVISVNNSQNLNLINNNIESIKYIDHPIIDESILQNLSILIIDDNLHDRILLTNILTNWGMKTYTFSNCEEALYYSELYKLDIGLVNISMPKINGSTFAIKLKEQNNSLNNNIPLIALSSTDNKTITNINHFKSILLKPIKENDLKIKIISVIKPSESNKISKNNIVIDEYYKNSIKILIVDDNLVNLKILEKFLEKLGYNNTTTAENGEQSINLFIEYNFDIIFMDIIMPKMNGDIALQNILMYKKTHPNKKIPFIIAISAYSLKEDKDKYLQMGFDDFITKPVNISNLEKCFSNYINKHF